MKIDSGQGIARRQRGVLSSVRVTDAFFYLFLLATVSLQTLGYGFGDVAYLGAVGFFGILLAVKVLVGRYSSRDIVVCVLLVALGAFLAYHTHKFTIILSAIILISTNGLDEDDVLGKYLAIKAIALAVLVLLAGLGVFDATAMQHYRSATGSFETRIIINGVSSNILHLGFCTVCALLLYKKYGHITLPVAAACMLANILLYLIVTRSVAGVMMTGVTITLFFLCSHLRRLEGIIIRISPFVPIMLAILSVVMGLSYGSSEIADFVNRLMTGRTAYDHYFLTTYGVSLFGADYAQLISEGNFDNSYVYSLVIYGGLFTALLYGSVTVLLWRIAFRGGSPQKALLLLVFLIYGLAESVYPSAVVNPSLFLLTAVLFDRRGTSIAAKRDRLLPRGYLNAQGVNKVVRLGTSSRMSDEAPSNV